MFNHTMNESPRLAALVVALAVSIVLTLGTLAHTVVSLVPQV